MQKLLTIILAFLTIFTLSLVPTHAEDVREELNAIEDERTERIENLLLLNIPEISDNPNHIVTFKDPSGNGVFLEINGEGFEEISSPYTLPSLSLGRHILTFKFADEQETEQTFEKTITIIPRPPVLNPPTIENNEITISGTAMTNSEIEIFLSREIFNQKALVDVNKDGEWSNIFSENIEEGIYTAIATTKRNGYSSYYSEPIVFEIGADSEKITPIQKTHNGVSFSFRDFDLADYRNTLGILRNNTDLLIAFGFFFVFGVMLTWILTVIIAKRNQKKSKKVLQELLRKKEEPTSLKDKFEKSKKTKLEKETDVIEEKEEGEEKEEKEEKKKKKIKKPLKKKNMKKEKEEDKKVDEEEKKEVEEEDEDEESKTLTKEEFLKRFQDFDPDDEDGEEKDLKKKSIKISLTSKD